MNFFLIIKKEIKILFKLILPIFIVMLLSFSIMNIILTMSFSIKDSMLGSISKATSLLRNEGYENIDDYNQYDIKIELTNFLDKDKPFTFKTENKEIILDNNWKYRQDLLGNIEFKNPNHTDYTDYSGNIKGTEYELNKGGSFINFNDYYKNILLTGYILNYSSVDAVNPIIISETFNKLLNVSIGDTMTLTYDGISFDVTVAGFYDKVFSTQSYIMSTECIEKIISEKYTITFNIFNLEQYFDFMDSLNQFHYISLTRDLNYENSVYLIDIIYIVLSVLTVLMIIILSVTIYSFLNTIINRRRKFLYQLKLIGFNNYKIILCYSSFIFAIIFVAVALSFAISSISINVIANYYYMLLGSKFIVKNASFAPIILLLIFTIISVVILSLSLNSRTTKKAIEKIRGV